MTALLVLPPFHFSMFKTFDVIPFQYILQFTVIELCGCLPFLIAIFRLEVCDIVIMLQFVSNASWYSFSIETYQGLFWNIR